MRIVNYIAGELVEPRSGRFVDNIEPAVGAPYGSVADSDTTDVDAAVAAAAAAFEGWSTTPADERCRLMLALADYIEHDVERFARAESIDSGKPLNLARTVEIPRAVRNLRFFGTSILHFSSEAHPTDHEALNYTLRRPRGVVGLISPWNLPLYLLTWKVAPAIAVGNTAVAKPSELTPATALLLAKACRAVGFPPGVLNIVHGTGRNAGAPLVAHPDVSTLSFTGSGATGAEIARVAAPEFKKLALEMGGKNPNIVFADADLDEVLEASLLAGFANQGQICLCGSRVFVERPVFEAFTERLTAAAQALKIGDPLEPNTAQGALVSAAHRDKVLGYIAQARADGGTLRCGGQAPADLPDRVRNGFFVEPTIITGLDVTSTVNQDEIFGPVVTVTPFDDERQVLQWANGTRYGLSASVWTRDISRAHRVAEQLEVGTVWINCWLLRDLRVPFGGVKSSGVGREGGLEALRFFTEPKNVCVRFPHRL